MKKCLRDSSLQRSIFDIPNKTTQLTELNQQISDKNFWNDPNKAQKISKEASEIEKLVSSFTKLEKDLEDFKELLSISSDESDNDDFENEIKSLEQKLSNIENEALFLGNMMI